MHFHSRRSVYIQTPYSIDHFVKMSTLQEKTNMAALDDPFAFTEITATNPNGNFDGEEYLSFQEAIKVKNRGNDDLKAKNFNQAIQLYGNAIAILQTLDGAKCGRELASCYQKRAEAYGFLNKTCHVIDNATRAIEADKTYAKGFYRRARGYMADKKFYLALEDILWACILEHFCNETYNKIAAEINAQHGEWTILHLSN